MWQILFAVVALCGFLWIMVRLRELRETPVDGLPTDEATLILGVYYGLSNACLEYYRDKGRYPAVMRGAIDGLEELGYINRQEVLRNSALVAMFGLVVTENSGYGICLFKCSPRLANDILDRAQQVSGAVRFMELDEVDVKFVSFEAPVKRELNLVLPLPFKPSSAKR